MVSTFVNEIIMRLEFLYGLQQLMEVAVYMLSVSFLFVGQSINRIRKNCGLTNIRQQSRLLSSRKFETDLSKAKAL